MQKYWAQVKLHYKRTIEHRFDMLIKNLQSVFTLLILFYFWKAVFNGKQTLNSYSFSEIITYYFLMRVIYSRVSAFLAASIAKEIKTGEITRYLIKPTDYIYTRITQYMTVDNLWPLGNAVVILLLSFFMYGFLSLPKSIWHFAFFIACVFVNGILACCINIIIGSVGFWITDVTHLKLLSTYIITILSGALIPLTFFPPFLQRILNALPFKYLVAFPIDVYFGKLTMQETAQGLTILLIWIGLLLTIARAIFNKGLRGYESFN